MSGAILTPVRFRDNPWVWWWELPGSRWWFPDRWFGRDLTWGTNDGWRSPCAWPGIIRCLFKPHANDSYRNCCYCGAFLADAWSDKTARHSRNKGDL